MHFRQIMMEPCHKWKEWERGGSQSESSLLFTAHEKVCTSTVGNIVSSIHALSEHSGSLSIHDSFLFLLAIPASHLNRHKIL